MQSSPQNDSGNGVVYDPQAAREFFKAAGTAETVAQGATIFTERERAGRFSRQKDKMFLLQHGEVIIEAAGKKIGVIRPGEIFGELAPLTSAARSAAAIAKTPCELISLDRNQFLAGLEKKPEFALMMMAVIIGRLREVVLRARTGKTLGEATGGKESGVFDRKLLRDLMGKLADPSPLRFLRGHTIFQEGGAGMLMYIVVEGCVVASIEGKTVERIGPGGVVGEIALIDLNPRLASVKAETDCLLLAIDRRKMLDLVKTQPAFGVSLLRALAARLRFMVAGPPWRFIPALVNFWKERTATLFKRDPY
ncbi:MAG TPA: cyclic nucleotide-binding domain-containing protein [Methylococcaceae bacterium]|nr:cyclic nucleotide-binding domain-containing protein [Methylococcaceae bacterium]